MDASLEHHVPVTWTSYFSCNINMNRKQAIFPVTWIHQAKWKNWVYWKQNPDENACHNIMLPTRVAVFRCNALWCATCFHFNGLSIVHTLKDPLYQCCILFLPTSLLGEFWSRYMCPEPQLEGIIVVEFPRILDCVKHHPNIGRQWLRRNISIIWIILDCIFSKQQPLWIFTTTNRKIALDIAPFPSVTCSSMESAIFFLFQNFRHPHVILSLLHREITWDGWYGDLLPSLWQLQQPQLQKMWHPGSET